MRIKKNVRYTTADGKRGLIVRSEASTNSPEHFHIVEICEKFGGCERYTHKTMTPNEIKKQLGIKDKKRLEVF